MIVDCEGMLLDIPLSHLTLSVTATAQDEGKHAWDFPTIVTLEEVMEAWEAEKAARAEAETERRFAQEGECALVPPGVQAELDSIAVEFGQAEQQEGGRA